MSSNKDNNKTKYKPKYKTKTKNKNKLKYKIIKLSHHRTTPYVNKFLITIKIGATENNWIAFLNYLEDGQQSNLYRKVSSACHDLRIIGPDSLDKRHKIDNKKYSDRKRYLAAALAYVSYWSSQNKCIWPPEFKKIIESCPSEKIRDQRTPDIKYLPRSIVFYHCKKYLKIKQKQDSFESQYFDKKKGYLKFAYELFKNKFESFTIDEFYEILPEPSGVNIKASLKSFNNAKL